MPSIAEKADYVRQELKKPAGGHHCHWPTCDKAVPAAAWGCKKHWYMLPPSLRGKIWVNYSPKQEIAKTPSREYVAVALEVRRWIYENHPETKPGYGPDGAWEYDL
jgi:hypothetical protein